MSADHIPSKDVFWLLETNWGPHIHYFGPTGGVKSRGGGHIGTEPHEFTKDVNNATRFHSREAATQFLDWMQQNIRHTWLGWKVAEHEWVGAAPETAAVQPDAVRAALQAFMDFQISDYYRQAEAARRYCDIRKQGRAALNGSPVEPEAGKSSGPALNRYTCLVHEYHGPTPCRWCPPVKANACQCDPNPSIGGSPPCPVHDGESEG